MKYFLRFFKRLSSLTRLFGEIVKIVKKIEIISIWGKRMYNFYIDNETVKPLSKWVIYTLHKVQENIM